MRSAKFAITGSGRFDFDFTLWYDTKNLFKGYEFMKMSAQGKKALTMGSVCAVAYCAVYVCRSILSALSPQVTQVGVFSVEQLGTMSSVFFVVYALGQLINGIIGDKVKGKYMVSLGLLLASFCVMSLAWISELPYLPYIVYGAMGFFLAMVYAPLTKLLSENNEPVYATRCIVGLAIGCDLGAPLAGLLAAVSLWQVAFITSGALLLVMGMVFFLLLSVYEKRGMVRYGQFQPAKERGGSIKILLRRQIVKWTLVSMLTGIVRTAVLFWLPSYISQHLAFPPEQASLLYTVATAVLMVSSFLSVFVYGRLKNNLNLSALAFFTSSAVCFLLAYFIRQPILNLLFMVLAMISSNCAACLMWNLYCPGLRDTGMVSGVTGFLDFASYMAAAISSKLFANAVGTIGWGNLILVWVLLMCSGVAVALIQPDRKIYNQPVC